MTDLAEVLKEYDTWSKVRSFSAPANSPEDFLHERRVKRLLTGLAKHVSDPIDDRYPIEEYLEEEDIVWLKSQRTTEVAVDGEV